jgi:hypothetical protein
MGNNVDGWHGAGSIALVGPLPEGGVGVRTVFTVDRIEQGGVIGVDGTPVVPGTYTAPGITEPTIQSNVVAGQTFYLVFDDTVTFVPGAGLPAFQNRTVTTPVAEGRQATVSGAIVDPSPQGNFLLLVDWGDGSRPHLFRFDPTTVTASVSHRYHKAGTFTIHLAWGDDRGTSNTADLTVTVLESHQRSGSTDRSSHDAAWPVT